MSIKGSENGRQAFNIAGFNQVGLADKYDVCELGLINHVVPDGQALAKAREIADRIASNGPLAVKAILSTLRQTETMPEDEAFVIERALGIDVMSSNDAGEGPRAFLEKREPKFTGT